MSETHSENLQSSTRCDEWLTVSQAAAALGISERQARRYAGRLDDDVRREGSPEAGHQNGGRPALVRLQAMRAMRKSATGRVQMEPEPDATPDRAEHEPDVKPDIGPDVQKAEAGHKPDALSSALVSQLQSENAFLRAQVEAANRQASEATVALREYLKMQAKALPSGEKLEQVGTGSSTRNEAAISSTESPERAINVVVSKAMKNAAQSGLRGEGLRELRAIFKKILGVR